MANNSQVLIIAKKGSKRKPMEFVKNKASGKLFVLLDDTGGSDFLVITPEGKVKRLERHLFEPQDLVAPGRCLF